MINDELASRVRRVVSNVLAITEAEVNGHTSISTVERWDSLSHVNLMMALEQEFNVRIDVDDAGEMTSVETICDRIRRYTSG